MANPAKAYLATQVETTTQGELLLMLYEAAIKFLKQAKVEIDNKDFAKKGIYISKAMAIIHELSESLNKEKGGDITPRLGQLYLFCTTQLVKANIRLDNKMIDDVIRILDGLRSAYAQVVPTHDGKAAPAASPKSVTPPTVPAPIPLQTQYKANVPTSGGPNQADKPDPRQVPPTVQNPPIQPKSAANAAKFRAANAYTNANR
ncbi:MULTISPECIES: flagellar export chaperone FliS [unclassified Pseudodesulfovibrio]|uniref:flagellar export chaperone FliS n=1 Tax=unclassified Pseudodesulfovibrio TaxID=2661612 RepID=UPI000FEBC48E|nr:MULTISPECIES: flagellar export chaperone FliS [unclassified Pseudodesulfovibrio]MCJ2163118.1 flagellar export chaperone FliS [Pseudodesulfovibrio sp. S3-i]RWU07110.1 flagellar export chaperone FliS [Pseudodesulfovibrio sp. S3]